MTSHDVVTNIRKLLKQKRVGHAGTLDPTANGVLPICVGQGTRVAEYLSESGKAYEAHIVFGIATDTYDAEGAVMHTADTMQLSLEQIEVALQHHVGFQMQMPPRYSAIKLQGQPAYKRVRAGEQVSLGPRPIEIYRLHLLSWHNPHLTLAVECSKGTYIRSLAHDLGAQLGCGAFLAALTRTRSGPFHLHDSVTLTQLAQGGAVQYLVPFDSVLQDYPALHLDAVTLEHVLHGNAFCYEPLAMQRAQPQVARVYDGVGHFVAVAVWDAQQHMWQPKKVFVQCN
ncbi:MAG: tRNA pseudouridine(55) synthase TruB [Ktedonobacteraceae bacterium]|nr:tRNA pseudouridine(55) synthase TruB [Ktedonobacteraceae bacterium]